MKMKRFSRRARQAMFVVCGLLLLRPTELRAQAAASKADASTTSAATPNKEAAEKLPTAKEIIDRYIREIGGKEAFLKIQSQHAKGKMEMPGQGMSGKLEVFARRPNKFLMSVELPGFGAIVTGFDGKVGWSTNAVMGPMLLEGKMLSQTRQQAAFDTPLHNEADYKTMEVVGLAVFEGKKAYKLKLVTKDGDESMEFYEVESGLLIGNISVQESQLGPVNATSVTSDYKKFGDLLFATRTEIKTGPISQILRITEMEFNTVEDAVFNPPASIKALTN